MQNKQTGIVHLGLAVAVIVIAVIAGVAYYVGHHDGGINANSTPATTSPSFNGSVAPTNINQQSPASQQSGSSISTTKSTTKSSSSGSSTSSSTGSQSGNTTGNDSTTPPDPAPCPYREVCPAQ